MGGGQGERKGETRLGYEERERKRGEEVGERWQEGGDGKRGRDQRKGGNEEGEREKGRRG